MAGQDTRQHLKTPAAWVVGNLEMTLLENIFYIN